MLHFRAKMKRKSHQFQSDNVRSQTSLDSDSRPISCSRNQFKVSGDDAPKTSEYAFFKKLKKDAGRTSSLCSLPKEDCQINKPKSSDRDGVCNVVRNCFKKLKLSLPCDDVDPGDVDCLSSPINYPSEISEKKANHKFRKTSGRLYSVTPVNLNEHFSPFQERAWKTGSSTQFQQDGVFSMKRQRLRQLATDVKATESENPNGKGTDIVSELLARLFPESNDDQKCGEQKLSKEEDDTISKLMFHPPDFEINSNTCYWSRTCNYNEPEVVMGMADGCVTFLSDHPRKADLSRWNVDSTGFLSNFTNKFHPPHQMLEHFDSHDRYQPINFSTPYQSRTCKYIESRDASWLQDGVSECASDQQRVADLSSWNGENMDYRGNFSNKSHFGHQLLEHFDTHNNYQSSHYSNYIEDMKYHSNGLSSIRQPQTLLLGWKYDEPKDPHDFPVASDDTKLYDILPALRNAGGFCDTGDTPGTDGLSFQHLLPKFLASSQRHHFSLAFYHDLGYERNRIEAEGYPDPPFSHQAEDLENCLFHKDSNILLSPQNQYWSTREIGRDNLHLATDSPQFPPRRSFGSELLGSLEFHRDESMLPFSIHRKGSRTSVDDSIDEILGHNIEAKSSNCSYPTFRTALEQDQAFLLPQDMFSAMNKIDRSQHCLQQKSYFSFLGFTHAELKEFCLEKI